MIFNLCLTFEVAAYPAETHYSSNVAQDRRENSNSSRVGEGSRGAAEEKDGRIVGGQVKLLWATDPHFDHFKGDIFKWAASQSNEDDILLITGDISNCNQLAYTLEKLDEGFPGQVLFILGNHDAYGGSIETAETVAILSQTETLSYLTKQHIIVLNKTVGLVGHDGWYDARLGNPLRTPFELSDFDLIAELKHYGYGKRQRIVDTCRSIADRCANESEKKLRSAAERFETIIFATHVSPYIGSSWHLGNQSDVGALPWFCSKTMGEAIDRVALDNENRNFLVLCGHSHSDGVYQHLPNVRVMTGYAKYGAPAVWKTFTIDEFGVHE